MSASSIHPFFMIALIFALALLPFLLLGTTSFVKLSVVFSLLRLGIGAQQVPSSMVTSLLATVLTLFIMSPVYSAMVTTAAPVLNDIVRDAKQKEFSADLNYLLPVVERLRTVALSPLLEFLAKHSRARERMFFFQLVNDAAASESGLAGNPPRSGIFPGEGFTTLAPAFLLSELRAAFALGFILFLPFLVVDLVVANLLVAMGMTMLSPITISLPLKIFLFVATDSWFLLIRSLIAGYG